jgi:enoyl-[acyl-carrier protein] reductase II
MLNYSNKIPHDLRGFMTTTLNNLWKKGTDFLGTKYAILGGAMTWVSDHNLVAAISNAGGFGVIACGAMPADLLRQEIQKTKVRTKNPFGVNLITMHPDLNDLVQVCIDEKMSHVVLAGGLPSANTIKTLKENGIKVICFSPALVLAKKLLKNGTDALVIEGMEAGGHIGPVSTTVLAQEILPEISDQVPVFIAGGIGRGEAILSYLEMGAAGCQLGTRFVCATECRAHPKFKEVFIRSQARDAIISPQLDPRFPVIPVRGIANKGISLFMEHQRKVIDRFNKGEIDQKEGQLEIEHFWAGSLRRAVIEGDIETGSLMAGQSVGMVKKEEPVHDIIQELIRQAEEAIHKRA